MPIWPILPNSQSMRDREDINRMRDQPKNPGMGTAESRCRALWTEQGVPAAEQDRLIALITSQAEHPPRFPPQPAAAPASRNPPMLDSLFPAAPFRSYAPERARLVKPRVAPVRFAGGSCNAACMYAKGDECTHPPMISTLDFFCGGGGSSLGASQAGATIIGAVDAWDIAADTFADNFPDAQVRNLRLHRRSNGRLFGDIKKLDLLLASPECTNHTCARGTLDWDEASRETALYVLNYARAFKPRWLVIENVIQMRNWDRYESLLEALRVDYKVKAQVLDAANFGVPQSRRRLFILCDRERDPPDLSAYRAITSPTARDILDPQGTWKAGPLRKEGRAADTLARADRAMAELGKGVPFLIVYYSTDGGGGWQKLDRPLRTLTTIDRFGLVEWQGREATLRMLQVPELQRAMGFTKDYKLNQGSRRDRIKLLGNGVCPPVMEKIVAALTGIRAETDAEHQDAVISSKIEIPLAAVALEEPTTALASAATRPAKKD